MGLLHPQRHPNRLRQPVNRSWRPLLEQARLPRIPFHNLRHTCASLLLSQGVHPKFVQELLGHADITSTLNTYSHVIPSLRGETASAMEDVLGEGKIPLRGEPPTPERGRLA